MTKELGLGIAEPGGFDDQVFAQIVDLNNTFIDLLCQCVVAREDEDLSIMGLAPTLSSELVGMPRSKREAMTACRFTLFDLRLRDETFWKAVRPQDFPPTFCSTPWAAGETLRTDIGAFALSAMLFAQHLCGVNTYAAKLTFGVSAAVADKLKDLKLSALTQAVVGSPGLLSCRFADNPRFWPDLVRYVREGSRQQCRAAHLLGTQLIVAG